MKIEKESLYEQNKILLKRIETTKKKEMEIQEKFKFIIPDYVLNEIAESDGRNRIKNINALINLAVLNKRITKENAETLKEVFVFHYI